MTSLEICNLALLNINQKEIDSFASNDTNAVLCKKFYPFVCELVLRDHYWSCAAAFANLARLNMKSPAKEFNNVFQLPPDLIRIVEVEPHNYAKVGNKILSNSDSITLTYVKKIDPAELFDSNMVEAIVAKLSVKLLSCRSRDLSEINYYESEYQKALAMARHYDSREKEIKKNPFQSSFINSRKF